MNKGYKTEKANTMDSVIVRTSLVTLAAVAGFWALLLLVLPFAAPSFCGRAMKSLGNDAAATHFYEIAYERHSDERRLSDYIETAYGAKKYDKVSSLGDDVFNFKDKLSAENFDIFATYVVESKYNSDDKRGSAEYAVKAGGMALSFAEVTYRSDDEYIGFIDFYKNEKNS